MDLAIAKSVGNAVHSTVHARDRARQQGDAWEPRKSQVIHHVACRRGGRANHFLLQVVNFELQRGVGWPPGLPAIKAGHYSTLKQGKLAFDIETLSAVAKQRPPHLANGRLPAHSGGNIV